LVDLGKVAHYHFDKVTHKAKPKKASSNTFIVMRPDSEYILDDDDSVLRGRFTWLSSEEQRDNAQNEILISADDKKKVFSVGRSNRRDI
jgi:hypothetical protein